MDQHGDGVTYIRISVAVEVGSAPCGEKRGTERLRGRSLAP